MSDYPNKRFGGPKRYDNGGRPPFRGGDRGFDGTKEMFDAECANCHKMTQVPFKPNGMKPVYCRDCFKPDGDRVPRGADRYEKREFPKKDFGPRREFAPSAAAPASRPDPRIDELKRQLDTMNGTLQHLVSVIENQNRKAELGLEVRKAITPAKTPVKAEKKPVKKAKKK